MIHGYAASAWHLLRESSRGIASRTAWDAPRALRHYRPYGSAAISVTAVDRLRRSSRRHPQHRHRDRAEIVAVERLPHQIKVDPLGGCDLNLRQVLIDER